LDGLPHLGQASRKAVSPSANTRPRRSLRLKQARGSFFWDDAGQRYTDLSSQTVNALLGQCHPGVNAAVATALDRFTFIDQDFECDIYDRAYELLAQVLPSHLTVANLKMNDGSSAVECAVKQARRYTGRPAVLTVRGIYLGQNAQVIHFRGLEPVPQDILNGGTESVVFAPMPAPNYTVDLENAPDENGTTIARMIAEHSDRLGAVVLDPVMISCGVFGGRDMRSFCQAAAQACRDNKIPLIVDECQSFGWVEGNTLSSQWHLEPDMLCLAKGVAAGLPLSVCAFRPEFDNLGFGEADYTSGGGIASVAAMNVVLETLNDKQYAASFSALVEHMIKRLDYEVQRRPGKLRTRGIGLIRCIELVDDDYPHAVALTRTISRIALERGIYVRTYGPHLGLKPSRLIERATLDEALDVLFATIDDALEHGDEIPPSVSSGFSF